MKQELRIYADGNDLEEALRQILKNKGITIPKGFKMHDDFAKWDSSDGTALGNLEYTIVFVKE